MFSKVVQTKILNLQCSQVRYTLKMKSRNVTFLYTVSIMR